MSRGTEDSVQVERDDRGLPRLSVFVICGSVVVVLIHGVSTPEKIFKKESAFE